MNKYMDDILNNSPIMPLAREVIDQLKKDGHQLIVITNRSSLDGKEKELTLKRFEKENLNFDKIVFQKGSKAPITIEQKIDVMIDNTPEVVNDLIKANINVIYFQDNTRDISHRLVKTVHNWPEVYRAIKNHK